MRITLKKNAAYWKEGRGHLDAVDITVINDRAARLNALISGQVDAINRVDHKAVELLSKNSESRGGARAGRLVLVIAMQVDKAPYDNPDMRWR